MSRGACATIHAQALTTNLARVRELAPNSRIWAAIKADAYGHGAIDAARALRDADGFALASLGEARQLRDAGVEKPLILLEGTVDIEQARQAIELDCATVVHQADQLAQLESLGPRVQQQPLWLKVDTGMHRLGVAPDVAAEYWQRLSALSDHPVGLLSHFAAADDLDPTATEAQLAAFERAERGIDNAPVSLANSAGILAWPQSHRDWVRPGIMLYGASPGFDKTGLDLGLAPAMTVTAPVIAIREVPAGDRVGYGGRWRAERPSRIATIAMGYGDGYPRHAPDGTPVWLGGQRVPLAGKVSMDMLTVDVTDLPKVQLGESAELWGAHLSVDEVAQQMGTVGYELLTRVSSRVPRQWRHLD
ncbi:alanine racemase [Saccharospirillum sp. MSK14-1]|uniref:alanine racemase n=1 Tax=Saccharospirillum sp. MSK14-1 TaxID=1897632 RepID=UPI000D36B791|nr:alanine racemase [Saccharospirillum sp. MSK14-1]PTY36140.1 alanine racemase [Saccharospirillum sp. MSK14-1]